MSSVGYSPESGVRSVGCSVGLGVAARVAESSAVDELVGDFVRVGGVAVETAETVGTVEGDTRTEDKSGAVVDTDSPEQAHQGTLERGTDKGSGKLEVGNTRDKVQLDKVGIEGGIDTEEGPLDELARVEGTQVGHTQVGSEQVAGLDNLGSSGAPRFESVLGKSVLVVGLGGSSCLNSSSVRFLPALTPVRAQTGDRQNPY